MSRLLQEIKKNQYRQATYKEYFPTFLNQEILFFGSRVVVHKQPVLFEVLAPVFFIL
jgi:hypothetical protein